jgi:hypothetical protein
MGDAAANNTPLMDRGNAISNAPKQVIPSDDLKEILMNAEYMKDLQPLIADVVKQASSIKGLRDDITKLFEIEAKKDTELSKALTALQKELQSIYEKTKGANQENPNEANEENPNEAMDKITKDGGGRRRTNKRRKSKKRNYYKKRRTSKYR